jgi:limonene-1,2-epoxide hydrolase
MPKSNKSALEIENEKIVTQFCLDWANRDADQLVEYLAEDIEYQMYEGRPDIVGHEQFKQELGGWLKGLQEVKWEILKTYSVGELVINERVDHFISDDPAKTFRLPIAGVFLVRGGKIKMWKDYSLPDGKS